MKYELRDYQREDAGRLRQAYRQGFKAPLYVLPTGGGKCLGKDTPVLLYNGKVKAVQNLKRTDILIGPDSKPRYIKSLCRGRELLYKIIPKRGEPFTCNESHVLSLKVTNIGAEHIRDFNGNHFGAGEIVNISIVDYLKCSKYFKHCAKLWKAPVQFKDIGSYLLDPYLLGLWLGDGSKNSTSITNIDSEIISYLNKAAKKRGLILNKKSYPDKTPIYSIRQKNYLKHGRKGGGNPILNFLKRNKLINKKHIPEIYKRASRESRLRLLAGLIDSDGYYSGKSFEIIQVKIKLAKDILFLARSLGFYASINYKTIKSELYHKVLISGNLDEIPCRVKRKKARPRRQKKNHLMTGFKVKKIGIGDYYGFELCKSDGLFMLGDFTVTHNTIVFCHIAENAAARENRVMILVHRKELLDQASEKLHEIGVTHGLICPKRIQTNDLVQIASVDTLIRRLHLVPKPKLIVFDEAHHVIRGNKWGKVAAHFPDAYYLGVTATAIRTNGDGLGAAYQGYFDTLINGPSIRQLIDQGWLSQPIIYAPPVNIDLTGVHTRAGDYAADELEDRIDKVKITGDCIQHYKNICPGVPALAFCVSIKHAENTAAAFNAAGISAANLDGTMNNRQRDHRIQSLANGQLKVLTSCEIVSEGTDIPVVTAAILLRPTKSLGLFLQQSGRVLRIHPGKRNSIILDHVNNTSRHGLIDDVRPWTLARTKNEMERRGNGDDIDRVRQCKQCFAVYAISRSACPQCGAIWIPDEKKIEQKAGQLKPITPEQAAVIREKNRIRAEQGKAQDLASLERLAQIRGYKPGWAAHIWAARQKKNKAKQNQMF